MRGDCTKPTCGLTGFNKAYLWFKTYHLTQLKCPPLDISYLALPFLLQNPLYYISQN